MAHLLIVDNDERIVELTQWFLERAGHRVDTALSYAAARELIRSRQPDLLLADLDLGQENGREELPQLARQGLLPLTIVVSGFLDAELDRELRLIPGVHSTLTKPIDLSQLLGVIAEALEGTVLVPAPAPVADVSEPEPPERDRSDDNGWVEIVPLRPDVPAAPSESSPTLEGGGKTP